MLEEREREREGGWAKCSYFDVLLPTRVDRVDELARDEYEALDRLDEHGERLGVERRQLLDYLRIHGLIVLLGELYFLLELWRFRSFYDTLTKELGTKIESIESRLSGSYFFGRERGALVAPLDLGVGE